MAFETSLHKLEAAKTEDSRVRERWLEDLRAEREREEEHWRLWRNEHALRNRFAAERQEKLAWEARELTERLAREQRERMERLAEARRELDERRAKEQREMEERERRQRSARQQRERQEGLEREALLQRQARARSGTTATHLLAAWRGGLDAALSNHAKMQAFPAPPALPCTRPDCPDRSETDHLLQACDCVIHRAFQDAGKEALKRERNRWHPDKFAICPHAHREEYQRMANQMFKVINDLYEKAT
ncbi:hypothetical protein LTR85_012091 [Meristemomyces frigidus]|nr:hypothetical protein LTR85_012091 [Meristemomyces frigidus]